MSPQPMPSARTSMSLCCFWKSSTIAFIAPRVAGFGSVSHIVTTTFFCARAGRAPTIEAAAAPAVVAPSRARNARRPRKPCRRAATRSRSPGSLFHRVIVISFSRV